MNGLSLVTGLVTASGTPESPTQDTALGECDGKPHTQTQLYTKVVHRAANKPLLCTAAKKQTNEISYEHFLLSNRNTKLNENLTKYF